MNRLRRWTGLPAAIVISIVVATLFAAGVGIAVLIGGTDATPAWMQAVAVGIAWAFGMTYVLATLERAMDTRIMNRACRYIDARQFDAAADELDLYVRQLEKVAGRYDPVTLRWTFTLAHLLLHTGERMRAMGLLALVIDGQLAVLGPNDPETRRSLRLLQRHQDITGPIEPIETWWR